MVSLETLLLVNCMNYQFRSLERQISIKKLSKEQLTKS